VQHNTQITSQMYSISTEPESHSGEDGVPVRSRRRLMQEEWTEDNQTLDLSRPGESASQPQIFLTSTLPLVLTDLPASQKFMFPAMSSGTQI
jgi:hypothetical protein